MRTLTMREAVVHSLYNMYLLLPLDNMVSRDEWRKLENGAVMFQTFESIGGPM